MMVGYAPHTGAVVLAVVRDAKMDVLPHRQLVG